MRALSDASIDPDRPIMSQISRFDPWKDPLGVIDVYRKVKSQVKDLQLVMVAAMAGDDPGRVGLLRKNAASRR